MESKKNQINQEEFDKMEKKEAGLSKEKENISVRNESTSLNDMTQGSQEKYSGNRLKKRAGIYSNTVRAGKRTYFFDVRKTKSNEFYITITESKKRYNRYGRYRYTYEKHKIFLYKEDFDKFSNALTDVREKILLLQEGADPSELMPPDNETQSSKEVKDKKDIKFEDLGSE